MVNLVAAVLAVLLPIVSPPKADATCHGSLSHLGTDNIPTSASDRATSIVNMWYVARSASDTPVFWIYQTYNGKQWVQANAPNAAIIFLDARETKHLNGIGVFPCFSQPFPSKYLPDR